jgi:hypothetical protein
MTARKDDILPRGDRPPAYVDRETGAAECRISPATWDEWVAGGLIPPPNTRGIAGTTPRWRWEDVDRALSGRPEIGAQCPPEPYFRRLTNGQGTKEKRRGAA